MKYFLHAAAFLTMMAAPATAQSFMTGNKLLDNCDSINPSYCGGYIVGVFDAALPVIEEGNTVYGFTFCAPQEVLAGQIRDVVVQWLQRNPSKRHYAAPSLVMVSLSEAYPCQ
ncbi:Rap1a/Tai family immunity protein [Sulfitobacter sp. 1A13353]|uniref:Rap1a/Tai family immunity protein n=1 Tax=Sulfitobacter sp. 1A13353 TaxID=3368568 RepID=UPI00374601F8